MTYTTYGSVRGCCGHKHRTLKAADKCAARDQAGCRHQGGYSDREVVLVGDDGYLYHDMGQDDWVRTAGGRGAILAD